MDRFLSIVYGAVAALAFACAAWFAAQLPGEAGRTLSLFGVFAVAAIGEALFGAVCVARAVQLWRRM
jgi:hypothetical protein